MQTAGKVAFVTGAGQGIGRATAQKLIDQGYKVVIAEIDSEAGTDAKAELGEANAKFVQTDVADENSVQQAIADSIRTFGRLDALVNNAGIFESIPLENATLADWRRIIGINLTGAFLCAKYAAPHLRATRGAIVNIASTRALMSEPNNEAYSASKGGLLGLTQALAMTLAPVRVNCVSPGWIDVSGLRKKSARHPRQFRDVDHAQHPVGRIGRPEDVAGLVAYLLSPEAEFITGQNFIIDGGMMKKMIYAE